MGEGSGDAQPDSGFQSRLPRISIVTPSFNQAAYLEEAIRSVLDQGYPDLEYIVMDAGSTDGSKAIIERYSEHIAYWQSRPDGGQANALNQGFAMATGDIFGWLCSDDTLKPGSLHLAGSMFSLVDNLSLVYGDTEYLYPDGSRIVKPRISYHYDTMRYFNILSQPSTFFSRAIYESSGGLDESLNYALDYELFLRFGRNVQAVQVPVVLSTYRMHASSKTVASRDAFVDENWLVREKLFGRGKSFSESLRLRYYFGRAFVRYRIERGVWKWREDRRLAEERERNG